MKVARVGRVLRGAAVAVLLPIVIVLHATIVAVLVTPFDRTELDRGSAPLVLVDVRGEELARLPAAGADRTQWTALGELPAVGVSAVIEAEDQDFWEHRGVDSPGIARALWLDARGGRFGGSTLTMQLARMLLGATNTRTPANKVREVLLALRIERATDKRTILEQWMNRAYFGNGAYGYEAAARLYFGRPARALAPGEAVLLAVLPRAPSGYDPLVHLDAAIARRDRVLQMLVDRGVMTAVAAADARAQPIAVARHVTPPAAPSFVAWALAQLPAEVRRAGGTVHTTLDLRLQRVLEARVAAQVAQLGDQGLAQAGMVVLDAQTTEVRALVGSVGESGIDIVTRRRNPGSALKPFVYATAIEQGASPASIAWDTRDTSADYFAPTGGVEHGPVRYRTALASSYNFAAVSVLEQVGVAHVMTALRAAGVAELPGAPSDYGLRLALGAAKVRLLDLTAGYGFLVRGGRVGTPRGLAGAVLPDGQRWTPAVAPETQVFSPQTSWLVMDMLSDPEARRPGFGMELPFDLPFPIAAKTGTARGFADTWAVGATREYIVGAWAGTFDGTATHGLVGMDAAAPLVRAGMLAVAGGKKLTLPARPDGVVDVEVCADSGLAPGPHCPHVHDYMATGHAALAACDWHDALGVLTYPVARARGWLARATTRTAGHE